MPAHALSSIHRRTPASTLAIAIGAMLVISFFAYWLSRSPMVGGICYAIGFLTLTWSRPYLALLLIMATVPFQQDVSGSDAGLKFSLAEINLALTIPLWLMSRPKRHHRAYLFGAALFLYLAISVLASVLHWRAGSSLISLLQMGLYLVVAVGVFARVPVSLKDYIPGLYALLAACVVLAIATVVVRKGYVMTMHKNGVGASLATAVVIGVELWLARTLRVPRRAIAIATAICLVGLILSLSRGSWLAAVIGVFVVFVMRREYRTIARVSVTLLPVLAIAWMMLPAEKRDSAFDFDPNRANIKARYESIALAREKFISSPVFGVGVGVRKEIDATNLWWVTLAETGVLGATAFIAIQASLLHMLIRLRRVISPSDPRFTFVILGGALAFGRLAHGMFDHYWSRGALMAAWAAVGMLVRVYGEAPISPGRSSRAAR
jgi:hypothetical protein